MRKKKAQREHYGSTSSRFRVTASEVARIREAEKKGDGLRVVLEILRGKNRIGLNSSGQ